MYRQFNIQQFHVPPTQCIYVFCVDLRTNSVYFPKQRLLIGFYKRDVECLLRGTDWIYTIRANTMRLKFLSINQFHKAQRSKLSCLHPV